jgi:hypothetical protein
MMVQRMAQPMALYNWVCSDGIAVKEDATPTAAQIAAARKELAQRLARSQMGNGAHYLLF